MLKSNAEHYNYLILIKTLFNRQQLMKIFVCFFVSFFFLILPSLHPLILDINGSFFT